MRASPRIRNWIPELRWRCRIGVVPQGQPPAERFPSLAACASAIPREGASPPADLGRTRRGGRGNEACAGSSSYTFRLQDAGYGARHAAVTVQLEGELPAA